MLQAIAEQSPDEDFWCLLRGSVPLTGDGEMAMRLMPRVWRESVRATYLASVRLAAKLTAVATRAKAEHPQRCTAAAACEAVAMHFCHCDGPRFARAVLKAKAEDLSLTLNTGSIADWDIALCRWMLETGAMTVLVDQFADAVEAVTITNPVRELLARARLTDADIRFLDDIHRVIRDWPEVAQACFLLRGVWWQWLEINGFELEITERQTFRRPPRGGRPVGLAAGARPALSGVF